MSDRLDWDTYYLGIAEEVSRRSDCDRSRVGAVVVRDNRIAAVGYNGSPAGEPGCETCPRRVSDCAPGSDYESGPTRCVAVHAEANALLYAGRDRCAGATLYVTRECCYACDLLARAAGITRVVVPPAESFDSFTPGTLQTVVVRSLKGNNVWAPDEAPEEPVDYWEYNPPMPGIGWLSQVAKQEDENDE